MIPQRHPVRHLARVRPGARFATPFALILSLGLAGCHHKPVRPQLPIGALAPIELEPSPPENPPSIAMVPEPELGPFPAEEPPTAPRRRATPAAKEPEPPVQVAANDASAATLAIGALSAGGEDTTHTSQQAVDLINAVLKRIGALSSQIASAQKKEVRQARNYLDQAQKALRTGDAEGAHTLATKANLLMDEVEKK